jgi:CRP-like cAMP-binding protein
MHKEEFYNLKNNIYPPSADKIKRNTYHHQKRIRVSLEDEDGKYSDKTFENFLKILKKNPNDRSQPEINLISHYANHTELIEKFKNEQDMISDAALKNLIEICSKNLKVSELENGEIVFKIDELADKFYIILKGAVSVLKPKQFTEYFTNKEYLQYLKDLLDSNEIHILQQTIKENFDMLPITDVKHLEKILFYFFKNKCRKALVLENVEEFRKIFENRHMFTSKDFNINIDEVIKLSDRYKFHSTQAHIESKNPWVVYVTERIKFSHKDILKYDKFKEMTKNPEKRKFSIFKYHKFLYLYAGQYFGDMALNSKHKKRNATIRAEEDSIVGYIDNDIYSKYIKTENLKVRTKDCQFINECLFDFLTPTSSLEKYHSSFIPNSYNRGFKIFKENSNFSHLILIKGGEVELNLNCSVMDIYNLIKCLVEKLVKIFKENKANLSFITEEDISYLLSLTRDNNLIRINYKSQEFIEGINKKRTSYVCLLPVKEICGIEEFFLKNLLYFCSAKVVSDTVKVIKIDRENLNMILINENIPPHYFAKKSFNKIASMIKRLNHIKNTHCEILLNDSVPSGIINKNSNEINYNFQYLPEENIPKREKKKTKIVYSYSAYSKEDLTNSNEEKVSSNLKFKKNTKNNSMADIKNEESVIKSLKVSVQKFIGKSIYSHMNENYTSFNPSRNLSIDKGTNFDDFQEILKENEVDKIKRLPKLENKLRTESFNSFRMPHVSLVNLLDDDDVNNKNSNKHHFSNSKNKADSLYNIFNTSNLIPGIIHPNDLPVKNKKINKTVRLPKILIKNIKENENIFSKNVNVSFLNLGKMHDDLDVKKDHNSIFNSSNLFADKNDTPNYPSFEFTRARLNLIKNTKKIEFPDPEESLNKEFFSFKLVDRKNQVLNLKALPQRTKKNKIKSKKDEI